jgi:hypothetical protein
MAAKMAALHLPQRNHLPQRYEGRGFSPPSGFINPGGQDGRPTSHSTLCRQASLPMAARMVALHSPQRYVGRGFFPAIRLLYPWRPKWPPYIYLNVV